MIRTGRKYRLDLMRGLLNNGSHITVVKLMRIFRVTEPVIRRDIEYLNAKYPFEVAPRIPRK